jgi:alpha/beta superfamily hydrolase
MPDITFNGPAGRLEGKYYQAKSPMAPIALVLHPHPQHGGTMNNKVTYRMYEAFGRSGFSVLRFNYRGVGNSEGVYDNGLGELSDAATALDWLHTQNPRAGSIWISGFSFGAWLTLQLLMRRPDVNRFIAVAPPAGKYDFSFFSPCPTSGFVLAAGTDDLAPADKIEAMLKRTARQKDVKIHYSNIADADHFFTNHQDAFTTALLQYIATHTQNAAA